MIRNCQELNTPAANTSIINLCARGGITKVGSNCFRPCASSFSIQYCLQTALVVGGGDSAVEAAMGLAQQPGNHVTLSYRKDCFTRLKERNTQRIQNCIRSGKVEVFFNSQPVEFKPLSVLLEVNGMPQEIPNDYVWIFAGGTPPSDFLTKIGVQAGKRDMTLEGSNEAKKALASQKQMAGV